MSQIYLVSSLLPQTNYSQYLCNALHRLIDNQLIVYTDKNPENKEIKDCGQIKLVWPKGIGYFFQIINHAGKDKPEVMHFQHEINMFGGPMSALIFPLLLLWLRLSRIKLIVTVHAVVAPQEMTRDFIDSFTNGSKIITPGLLKLVFQYLYHTIGLFSHQIIVHTLLMKKILIEVYGVNEEKLQVIPHGVPVIKTEKVKNKKILEDLDIKGKYFLYFGYIARRKGLENVINGWAKFLKKNQQQQYQLILAGGVISGQEFAKAEIEKLINDLGINNQVKLVGFVTQKQIAKLFIAAYAVVIPAKISISASGPLAQAFAFNKCVLVSKIGNFIEEINHNRDGILVDNQKWDEAFNLLAKNPNLVKQIERQVKFKAQQRSWGRVAEQHLSIYRQLCPHL